MRYKLVDKMDLQNEYSPRFDHAPRPARTHASSTERGSERVLAREVAREVARERGRERVRERERERQPESEETAP